ncbi:MAG: hypothetical protein RQ761_08195 [Bacteroidales bacterium]|nr:hypothetical protein [Bacteroidales bacterium]
MNGNLPQKRSYALSPDRNITLILEMLLLVAGGALAAMMHFKLRIPLNLPGHHGLEFMAIFVLIRLSANVRYAATLATLGTGIIILIPGMGATNPLHSFSYLLPGLFLDFFYIIGRGRMHLLMIAGITAGISYMMIPLSRLIVQIFIAFPYMAFVKFGVAYTVLCFLLFGMLGGILGYGLFIVKSVFNQNKN